MKPKQLPFRKASDFCSSFRNGEHTFKIPGDHYGSPASYLSEKWMVALISTTFQEGFGKKNVLHPNKPFSETKAYPRNCHSLHRFWNQKPEKKLHGHLHISFFCGSSCQLFCSAAPLQLNNFPVHMRLSVNKHPSPGQEMHLHIRSICHNVSICQQTPGKTVKHRYTHFSPIPIKIRFCEQPANSEFHQLKRTPQKCSPKN